MAKNIKVKSSVIVVFDAISSQKGPLNKLRMPNFKQYKIDNLNNYILKYT